MKRHAVTKCITGIAFLAVIVGQCLPDLWAKSQDASQFSVRPALHASLSTLPIVGDFDGDRRLDRAELHLAGAHSCVRVQFGNLRESHLAFHDSPQVLGILLSRDINHDDKPDLVWVSHFQSEQVVVWLGDGLGHFLDAASRSADSGLRTLLFGDSDPGIAGIVKDQQVFLTPDPASSELARAELDTETCNAVLIAGGIDQRDPGLYLSYLRERGPPLHTSFV